MTVIATDTQRLSNLVKREHGDDVSYCREVVTYNDVAKDFAIGDLVDIDGVVPATAGAIYGVVMQDVSAPATTATKVLVLFRGPATVSKFGLNVGLLAAADVYAALEAKGIQVLDAV